MTVQGYVQKYFGWNAEDYADFVLTLRLQPNDLAAYWYDEKLPAGALDRLDPMPTTKAIFRQASSSYRSYMRDLDAGFRG